MFVESVKHFRRNRRFGRFVEADPATMVDGSPGVGIRNPLTRFLVLLPVADAYRLADLIVDAAERASHMYESDDTSPATDAGR